MNELERLERLLDQLLDGIERVLQSGEELSDEYQGLLAQEISETFTRINQLRGQQQPPEQPPAPLQQTPRSEPGFGAPPSADAQLLFILAGQQEDAFLEYLRTYPTPATQALLNNPAELERTLRYLHEMMPSGQQPIVDGIQHAQLNSSNIWGTAYNPGTGQMKVRFQNGSEYEYDGVPTNIYRAFTNGQASAKTTGSNQYGAWWQGKNPSLGAAMNQYIKSGNFPYRRIR